MGFSHEDTVEDLRRAYDAKVDERDSSAVEPWKSAERSRFLAMLQAERRQSLVDIGAATGVHAAFFSDAGVEVTCVDLSHAMAEHCRARGFPAFEQDVLQLDLTERFAAAFAMNSLLHILPADLRDALERIRAVLEPGALFYLGQYGGAAFEGPLPGDHYEPKRYFSRLTDEHLCGVAAEVFTLVDFRAVDVGEDPRGSLPGAGAAGLRRGMIAM
jgi:SAM-dependent methyltransferase